MGMLDHEYRTRYSEGLFALRIGGGFNRYLGDFRSRDDTRSFTFGAMYSIRPFLSAGLRINYGIVAYTRDPLQVDATLYDFQFGETKGMYNTEYSAFHLALQLTPLQFSVFDLYGFVGAGVAVYNAQDHRSDLARVRPKADLPGTISVPFGVGLDIHLTSVLAMSAELQYTMLFTGDFDAYDDKLLTIDYIKAGGARAYRSEESRDHLFMVSVGLKVFLFQNEDYDGDLISNWMEERLGSDPYNPDTDGDGLSDYEEIHIYGTDPLRVDTDGDGLSDYEEVRIFRTNPLAVDTDGDGLSDFDEIYIYGTNPLLADTDGDGLTDKEEIELGTDPRHIDTDRDGLTDADEVRIYGTDPLKADTDGDGIFDYNEIFTYFTNPLSQDTDGDNLTDYEEIAFYGTSPILADTDGDNLTDDYEIVVLRTNPLDRDTDGDGIPDDIDLCPLVPENYNGFEDDDGCPDVYGVPSKPIARHFPPGQGPNRVRLADGGRGTGPGTGVGGDRGRGTGPGTGVGGDRGRGTGPGTGVGGDDGRGTGPGTGVGGDDGRGTAPGAGIGGDAERGTLFQAGAEGDWGTGTGVSTGIGEVWNRERHKLIGPLPKPFLHRYYEYDPRHVKHVVPRSMIDTSYRFSVDWDLVGLDLPRRAPEFSIDNLEEGKTFTMTDVHFDFDSDRIRHEYLADLMEKAKIFRIWPEMVVEIRGHTDNEGRDDYNLSLSMRRALAVKSFFVKQGIQPLRLIAKGFGKTRPLTDNTSELGKAINRRVEIHVLTLGKKRPERR